MRVIDFKFCPANNKMPFPLFMASVLVHSEIRHTNLACEKSNSENKQLEIEIDEIYMCRAVFRGEGSRVAFIGNFGKRHYLKMVINLFYLIEFSTLLLKQSDIC